MQNKNLNIQKTSVIINNNKNNNNNNKITVFNILYFKTS